MDEKPSEVRFGMPLEAAQTLHEALSNALNNTASSAQTVTVSIKQETVERFQAMQSQSVPLASAVMFVTEPKDDDAEPEPEGEEPVEEDA